MLLGLAFATSGRAEVLACRSAGAAAALPKVGSLIEGPAFYPYLNGQANLARCDAADPTADPRTRPARIGAALDRVGLSVRRQALPHYSLGMKQRLAIAAGLLRPRELICWTSQPTGSTRRAPVRCAR